MQPDNPQDDRGLTVPPRDDAPIRTPDREAAARLMREQIDKIYDTSPQPHEEQPAAATRVYHQTHSDQKAHEASASDPEWRRYHSAWQQYYQQYYERYYLSQLHARTRQHGQQAISPATATPVVEQSAEESVTKDQAVHEIRDELLGQVKRHSEKVRKSRHFMPIISALVVGLVFLLLQYNRIFIAQIKSYVSPGSIAAQNIIIDPTSNAKVGPEPKLIIPKINVDAPVMYDINSLADAPIQKALKHGVVHYPLPGADSMPGQQGNTVILGHSSNDVFDDGDYKFVFVQLEKMQAGDTFYINYNSVRYTYRIKETKVILPNEVSKLVISSDKPLATLVTCVPVGTALKRLVVTAEQVSPDPSKAASHTASSPSSKPAALPGNSPSLFERIFGGGSN